MSGASSPFLDRLAAADGAHTHHASLEAPQHAQHAQHAQHQRTSPQAQMPEELSQPVAGSHITGPKQATNLATDVHAEPDQASGGRSAANQATTLTAESAEGTAKLPTGAFSDEEEEGACAKQQEWQSDAAAPLSGGHPWSAGGSMSRRHSLSGGQTPASNLAFQHELQQRSGERQARAEASGHDRIDAQTADSRGVQGGQQGGQRGLRYHAKLCHTWEPFCPGCLLFTRYWIEVLSTWYHHVSVSDCWNRQQ